MCACDGSVDGVAYDAARPAYVPDDGLDRHWRCRDCGQWFWKGGHWASVADRVSSIGE